MSSQAFPTTSLREIAEINPKIQIEIDTQLPHVPMEEIIPGNRYVKAKKFKLFNRSGSRFLNDDILFARIEPCLQNGKIAQYQDDLNPIAFGSTEFIVLRAKSGITDPDYLFYLTQTRGVRENAEKSMAGASGRQRVNFEFFQEIEVPFPNIQTQKIIGRSLRAFDDLIENNRRRINILEESAKALYREWFVHYRYPGHENDTMFDSELGPIPKKWKAVHLKEIVSTQYGYTESATKEEVGPRYLRGMDINKTSFIDWDKVPFCPITDEELKKFSINKGDIFIIRMADPGKIGICETEELAVFASYLVRITSTAPSITPYFLFYSLSDERYQNWITGASTGSTRKSISAKVMVEPLIVVPPDEIITKFETEVTLVRSALSTLVKQNSNLQKIRDLLLPRLVSGELDVSDLDLVA